MKNIKIYALLILAAGLCGCSKWTQPEAKDIIPAQETPSEQYLEGLRAFKKGEHKVSIFGMDALATAPAGRFQHLDAMPDSADFIYVRNLEGGLYPSLAAEIAEIRVSRGTRTLADVDFASICDSWDAMQSAREDAGQPRGTEAEFTAFCREALESQLKCCETYGMDGIMASFNGAAEFALAGRACFVNTLMEWLAERPAMTVYVRGILSTLIRNTTGSTVVYDVRAFFDRCAGLLYDCGTEYSTTNIEMAIDRIIDRGGANVPTDKFFVEVTVPTPADPEQIGLAALDAAAWVKVPYSGFGKAGLCVSNAQDDYFHAGSSYGVLRGAINIMNE